ncbi:MAG TPA: hypothetical protein VK021_10100, partial [Flavobacteriaceae bacterium]|nr:hypothetical protein [Flavobacteriaceae bacterium]
AMGRWGERARGRWGDRAMGYELKPETRNSKIENPSSGLKPLKGYQVARFRKPKTIGGDLIHAVPFFTL